MFRKNYLCLDSFRSIQNLIEVAQGTGQAPYSRRQKRGSVAGVADAVVLINPAFEAARYSTLNDLIRNKEAFSQAQPPLMLTVSTNNDLPNKWVFPFGQLLDLAFDERARTTLGNYHRYYTHSLLANKSQCSGSPSDLTEDFLLAGLCLKREPHWHLQSEEEKKRDPHGWSNVTPEHQKHNPFLVAWTTKDVIDNHGGFWGPNHDVFSNWLFDMLNVLDSCNEQEAGCVPNQQIHQ